MAEKPQGGSSNRNNQNRQGGNRNRNRNRQGGNRNGNRQNNNKSGNRNGNKNGGQRSGNRGGKKPAPKKLTLVQKILSIFGIKPKQATKSSGRPASKKQTKQGGQSRQSEPKKSTRQPQRVEVESSRLYLGNLSYEATEYDLEDLFKGVGAVKGVEIIYNRHTHKSKGYGFIEMQKIEDAKRAVEVLHDQPFMGRNLIVNGAKGRRPDDAPKKNESTAS